MTTERDPDFKANPAPPPSDFLAASDAISSSHHTTTTAARPEHYPQRTDRAEPVSGSGMGTLLGSGLLALLMGGAGAWAYENYIGPQLAKNQAADKTQTSTENSTAAGGTSELASKFEDLSEKFRDLETRVANLPKSAPVVDTEAIGKRIEAAEERAQKVEAMNTQLKDLPIKLDEETKRVTALVTDMETVQKQVTELRTDMSAVASKTEKALKPDETTAAATKPDGSPTSAANSEPPREIEKLDVTTLAEGIAMFQHGDYAKANEFFQPLTKTRADDARVWYYAALSRGLSTRDWKGETEDLVKEGVKREKAGQPDKSEIDATFIGLTTATGKDWLGFFRKQAE